MNPDDVRTAVPWLGVSPRSALASKGVLLGSILLAAGCASSGPVRSLVVAANNPAATVVERDPDGTVTLRSLRTHIVAVLPQHERFSQQLSGLPAFYVIVTNGGKANLTLAPHNIAAYAGDARVELLDPGALQERRDREEAAAGMRASYPMADASQPADARRHRSIVDPKLEPFNRMPIPVPERLVKEALLAQVIKPGEVGGGRIVLAAEDILSGLPLKIVVTVAGEKHEFRFEVRY